MDKNKEILEEQLQFQLPEDNQFPIVIFEGLTPLQIKDKITADFIAMQERGVKASRIMTDEEINEIRAEYGDIAEQQMPELREELELITANYKAKKERLTAELTALDTQFKDLVSFAKDGTAVYEPDNENTFKIPVAGHYLYYTHTGTMFQLIAVRKIPDNERYDLFNTGEKNKEMLEAMGYKIPDFSVENKENYRVIEFEDGERVEIWEQDGKEKVLRHYIEDFLDDDSGEIRSIESTKNEEYAIGDNPYENTFADDEIETQAGTTDEISGDAEG